MPGIEPILTKFILHYKPKHVAPSLLCVNIFSPLIVKDLCEGLKAKFTFLCFLVRPLFHLFKLFFCIIRISVIPFARGVYIYICIYADVTTTCRTETGPRLTDCGSHVGLPQTEENDHTTNERGDLWPA